MKPYGQHKPFKECICEMCWRNTKKIKAKKKLARQRAKKEITNETLEMAKTNAGLRNIKPA